MEIAGNGDGNTRWKVPGVLDWATVTHNPFLNVTKDTATLYGSDREVFLLTSTSRRASSRQPGASAVFGCGRRQLVPVIGQLSARMKKSKNYGLAWLKKIAVNEATNRIYVTGITDGRLTTIDGATNQVIATDYYDYFPYSVAVDPVRNKIYLLDVVFDVLSVVDGATGMRTGNVSVSPGPFPTGCASGFVPIDPNISCLTSSLGDEGITVNPVTGKIYVTYVGAVSFVPGVFNTYCYLTVLTPIGTAPSSSPTKTPNEVFADTVTLAAGAGAVDAALNKNTNTLYIANSGANTVSAFNRANQAITATTPLGTTPRAITFDESTNTLYTFNVDGLVSVLDTSSDRLVSNFPVDTNTSGLLGLNPQHIAHSRRTGKLYAINGFNQIDVIDPRLQKVLTTIPHQDASNVAINQSTNAIYVSQYSDGTVWIIDGLSDQVVDIIGDT